MAASLTASLSTACTGSRQFVGEAQRPGQLPGSTPRLAVRTYAAKEDNKGLSFKSNSRAALGYLEEDSAGQTNIFAVEPKQYVQGGSRDPTQGTQGLALVGVAGAFAVGAIALGLVLTGGKDAGSPIADVDGDFLTLSQYKAKFSSSDVAAAPRLVADAAGTAVESVVTPDLQ
ncbi:hypothetical protein WJX72_006918 [[Myrmecia] bisecta]|uniref:Uncharacterized protein n=1 Tax=[Myrmecia] bisecta TaxID=41462 RepID=A0AAW1P6X1_9CHLO